MKNLCNPSNSSSASNDGDHSSSLTRGTRLVKKRRQGQGQDMYSRDRIRLICVLDEALLITSEISAVMCVNKVKVAGSDSAAID